MEVLKQTSPSAFPSAPMPLPHQMLPSPRTSAALQSGGRTGGGALGPSLIGGTILLRGGGRGAASPSDFRPWSAVSPSLATRLMLHVRANGLEIICDGVDVKSGSKIKL